MKKETKEFMYTWVKHLKNPMKNIEEYLQKSNQHIGWLYSFKGKDIRCIHTSKEDAFQIAYNSFTEHFGEFGVDENDMTFEPLFEGITLGEYVDKLKKRKAEVESAMAAMQNQ
ncbi:MAG TPA: hypothetical protein VJ962_12655 [Clostridia bacterium]|nr:hypothetical protein [Clostridia bacterium]